MSEHCLSPPKEPPPYPRRRGVRAMVLGVLALGALAACDSERAAVTPGVDLSRVKSIYVVREASDDRGINNLLVDQLTVMGYNASTGEAAARPREVDAILTYRDDWRWEITPYMLALDVALATAATNLPLASGSSRHSSLIRKSPADMVEEVLGNIIAKNPRRPG